MGRMGHHCPRKGCSVLVLKHPWSGRDVAAAKVITDVPQETKVTTHLAASLGVEAFIASPAEIASNMGATREAPVGVARASK